MNECLKIGLKLLSIYLQILKFCSGFPKLRLKTYVKQFCIQVFNGILDIYEKQFYFVLDGLLTEYPEG